MVLNPNADINYQKKRGSLSRVKSTPKEEGGGDKSELPKMLLLSTSVRTLHIVHEAPPPSKSNLCIAQPIFTYADKQILSTITHCIN